MVCSQLTKYSPSPIFEPFTIPIPLNSLHEISHSKFKRVTRDSKHTIFFLSAVEEVDCGFWTCNCTMVCSEWPLRRDATVQYKVLFTRNFTAPVRVKLYRCANGTQNLFCPPISPSALKTCLHQASALRLWRLWDHASDTALIKNNLNNRSKMGCNPNLEQPHCFQWEQNH